VPVTLGKCLNTLGTEHSAKNLSAKPPLPNVFYRALGGKARNEKIRKKT
jgi:hypothetical protein